MILQKRRFAIILFLFASFLFFSHFVQQTRADPPSVMDVEGDIFELDGITPIQISVNVSITNLNTSMYVQGMTSQSNPSHFKISIGGNTSDTAILQVKNREHQNNKTILLGIIKNESITLNMNIQNYAPDFISVPITTATENQTYIYDIDAQDYNFDAVTLSLAQYPSTMTISGSRITWTPTQSDVDASPISVRITASDGILSNTQNYTIAVANVNNPPSIISYANVVGKESSAYSYQVVAQDPDHSALYYNLITKPAGMSVNAAGLVSWTPSLSGSYLVILNVSDLVYDELQEYLVFVGPAGNNEPIISSTPSLIAYANTQYTYSILATDADGNPIYFEILESPYDAYIISNRVFWTPLTSDVNTSQRLVIRAIDSNQGSTMQVFYVNTSSALQTQTSSSQSSSSASSSIAKSGLSGVTMQSSNLSDSISDGKNSSFKLIAFGFKDSSEKNASKIIYTFSDWTVQKVSSFFEQKIKSAPNLELEILKYRQLGLPSPASIIYGYFNLEFLQGKTVNVNTNKTINSDANRPYDSIIEFGLKKSYLESTGKQNADVILLRYDEHSSDELFAERLSVKESSTNELFANKSSSNKLSADGLFKTGFWNELNTTFLREESGYLIFKAHTTHLGHFAISIKNLITQPSKTEYKIFPSINSSSSRYLKISGIIYTNNKFTQVDKMTSYSIVNNLNGDNINGDNKNGKEYLGYTGLKDENNPGGFENQIDASAGDVLTFKTGSYTQSILVDDERSVYVKIYSDISPSSISTLKYLIRKNWLILSGVLIVILSIFLIKIIKRKTQKI